MSAPAPASSSSLAHPAPSSYGLQSSSRAHSECLAPPALPALVVGTLCPSSPSTCWVPCCTVPGPSFTSPLGAVPPPGWPLVSLGCLRGRGVFYLRAVGSGGVVKYEGGGYRRAGSCACDWVTRVTSPESLGVVRTRSRTWMLLVSFPSSQTWWSASRTLPASTVRVQR